MSTKKYRIRLTTDEQQELYLKTLVSYVFNTTSW